MRRRYKIRLFSNCIHCVIPCEYFITSYIWYEFGWTVMSCMNVEGRRSRKIYRINIRSYFWAGYVNYSYIRWTNAWDISLRFADKINRCWINAILHIKKINYSTKIITSHCATQFVYKWYVNSNNATDDGNLNYLNLRYFYFMTIVLGQINNYR